MSIKIFFLKHDRKKRFVTKINSIQSCKEYYPEFLRVYGTIKGPSLHSKDIFNSTHYEVFYISELMPLFLLYYSQKYT